MRQKKNERAFTVVYNDFLDSDLLNKHEKLIFIALKQFVDDETMKASPSLKTLCRITGISIRWVTKSLAHMEELGVISVEHRAGKGNGNLSNVYTLHDCAEMWKTEDATANEEMEKQDMIDKLQALGYVVTKKKELESTPTYEGKKVETSKNINPKPDTDSTTVSGKSQGLEEYTLEQVKQIFDYDGMLEESPDLQHEIDSTMGVLHNALNTSKKTIRIFGQNKPAKVVIEKLLKLGKELILYAIQKFTQQTKLIKNPVAYLLTILYNAPEQYYLETKNRESSSHAPENPVQEGCKREKKYRVPKSRYANFSQRDYDFEQLEKELVSRQIGPEITRDDFEEMAAKYKNKHILEALSFT